MQVQAAALAQQQQMAQALSGVYGPNNVAAWMSAQAQQQQAAMWGAQAAAWSGPQGGYGPGGGTPWSGAAGAGPPGQPGEEARICFPFLNKGFCQRGSMCKYRHLPQDHPDAIADRMRTGHHHRIPGNPATAPMDATLPAPTGGTPMPQSQPPGSAW